MYKQSVRKIINWLWRLWELYTFVTVPSVWAALVAAVAIAFGWFDGLSLTYILLAVLIAVTLTVIFLVRFDDAKQRFNPRDKLKFEPAYWYLKTGTKPDYLKEVQIGLTVWNSGTFPMMYRVNQFRTTFDETHKAFYNFPWPDSELGSNENREARDATLVFKQKKKLTFYTGELEYSIDYWRLGRKRKYTRTQKLALEFRFDVPEPSFTWRVI